MMKKKTKTKQNPLAAWQSQYHTSTPPKVIKFQIKVFNSCKADVRGAGLPFKRNSITEGSSTWGVRNSQKPSKSLREQLSLPNEAISTVSGTLTPFRHLFTQSTQNTAFNSSFFFFFLQFLIKMLKKKSNEETSSIR